MTAQATSHKFEDLLITISVNILDQKSWNVENYYYEMSSNTNVWVKQN